MKKIFLILLTSLAIQSYSQLPSYEYNFFSRSIPNEGVAVPNRYTGESQVKFSKRVHRVIDSRMKQNKVLAWPRNPLNQILWQAVTDGFPDLGKAKAYTSDSLSSTLTKAQLKEKTTRKYKTWIPNPLNPNDPNDLVQVPVEDPLDVSTLVKFRIMEDWIFDAKYSDLRPRIIAIAPIYQRISESGVDLGEHPLFWVKMDELRPILAQQEIFNRRNDAARMSYDHWFSKRLFASHIVKESNVYDTDIAYQEAFRDDGVEALLEGERIKNDLFVTEHDLWEY